VQQLIGPELQPDAKLSAACVKGLSVVCEACEGPREVLHVVGVLAHHLEHFVAHGQWTQAIKVWYCLDGSLKALRAAAKKDGATASSKEKFSACLRHVLDQLVPWYVPYGGADGGQEVAQKLAKMFATWEVFVPPDRVSVIARLSRLHLAE
jgi:hypothetical protein